MKRRCRGSAGERPGGDRGDRSQHRRQELRLRIVGSRDRAEQGFSEQIAGYIRLQTNHKYVPSPGAFHETHSSPSSPGRRRLAGLALSRRLLAGPRIGGAAQPRRRMVCICTPLGLHPDNFFPEKTGKDYELTPYLEVLKDFRDDFTVISGLSHAGMSSGFAHQASASFLTGVPGAGRPGFRNSISLDQFAAEHIGGQTRFPSLALSGEGAGPVVDPNRGARAGGQLAVAGVRPTVPRRQRRRSASPGASSRRRPEHPRRRPRSGQPACGPTSAPTIATSSTSTSPASANWSSGWPRTKAGPRRPSPRSMSSRPRTFPTRPT